MDASTRARIAAEHGLTPEAAAMLDDSSDVTFADSLRRAVALTIDPEAALPWDQRTGKATAAGLTPEQIRKASRAIGFR